MRLAKIQGIFGVVALACVTYSSVASADPPRTANTLQLGVGFRYGASLEDGDLNPWGPGLGVDVGYTLPAAVYVGGVFDYFFGETISVLGLEVSANIWQLGAEVGYDVGAGDAVVIRPKFGAGMASINGEICNGATCQDDSETDAAIAPGVKFMFFPGSVRLSLDARYQMIFADPETADGLIFSFGIGF